MAEKDAGKAVSGRGSCVKGCSCKSEFQDAVYGVGKRLHNNTKDGAGRCTVCKAKKDH